MGHEHHQQGGRLRRRPTGRRGAAATWVSVAVNLLMTIAQVVVGWLAHSQSLIAHGLHSFSDLLSDFLVIYATRQSAHPADAGASLRPRPGRNRGDAGARHLPGLIGGGILWESGMRLQHVETASCRRMVGVLGGHRDRRVQGGALPLPDPRRRAPALATADRQRLHTRADAASALVVVVGIGGACSAGAFSICWRRR
jgi:hypothetical protein